MDDIEQRVISNKGGLKEHETRIINLENQCSRLAEEGRMFSECVDNLLLQSRCQTFGSQVLKRVWRRATLQTLLKFIPTVLGEKKTFKTNLLRWTAHTR